MKKFPLIFLMFLAAGLGCTTLTCMSQMEKFKNTVRAYENAVQWSDFDRAGLFLNGPPEKENLERLDTVRVVSYEVKESAAVVSNLNVRQVVQIRYYRLENNVVRQVEDIEIWEYDPERESWYLTSGLPNFDQ